MQKKDLNIEVGAEVLIDEDPVHGGTWFQVMHICGDRIAGCYPLDVFPAFKAGCRVDVPRSRVLATRRPLIIEEVI